MCKICTFEELENCNTIKTKSRKTGLGKDDRLYVTLWSEKYDDGGHMLNVTLENRHGEGLVEIGIIMNYCPGCGKKLKP